MGAVRGQEESVSQGVVVLQKETEEKFSIWKREKGCKGKNLVRSVSDFYITRWTFNIDKVENNSEKYKNT